MTRSTPHVTVVVPCRNECHHIEACLRSILAQAGPPGGMEVVISDGMSDDGTRETIRRIAVLDPRVRLIDNPLRITPAGLNLAIRSARGQIVIRMDAHTEYAPDYIERCLEVLEQTGADNVGGPACTKAAGYVQRAIAAAHHSFFSTGGARFHCANYEGPVDTVFYGCWHKDKLLAIGLFDEELVRNQDDELNYRIKKSGGRLWQSPRIRCWYSPRASLVALFMQYFQYGYWKVRVFQKHGTLAAWRHFVPVLFVLGLLTGWLAGFIASPLWHVYAAAIAAYAIVNVAFSVRGSALAGWGLLPVLPIVFFVHHLSYGLGFAIGIVNFYLLLPTRRTGGNVAAERTPADESRAAA